MGCGCGGAKRQVTKYAIEDDPQSKKYLTELEAKQARTSRGLTGNVVPVQQG